MDEQLQQIAGTLARTAQRKNTVLYKLNKKREQEEFYARLGISTVNSSNSKVNKKNIIDSDPQLINDIPILKYIIHEVKKQIGNAISFLRNSSSNAAPNTKESGEEMLKYLGEETVRRKNDEINRLIFKNRRLEIRMSELQNAGGNSNSNSNVKSMNSHEKQFFGVAKFLPEALKIKQDSNSNRKRQREEKEGEEEEEEEGDTTSDYYNYNEDNDDSTSFNNNNNSKLMEEYRSGIENIIGNSNNLLLEKEREAEQKLRNNNNNNKLNVELESPEVRREYIISYATTNSNNEETINLPSEEEYKKKLIEKRKEMLREKIEMLKNQKWHLATTTQKEKHNLIPFDF